MKEDWPKQLQFGMRRSAIVPTNLNSMYKSKGNKRRNQRLSRQRIDQSTLMDRRWQLAMDCWDMQESPFIKGAFVAFCTRLIEHQMYRRSLDRTTEIAAASKAFGARNLRAALDTSPLLGAGRVEDTYSLLGRDLQNALGVIAR